MAADYGQADLAWQALFEQTALDEAECYVAGVLAWKWSRCAFDHGLTRARAGVAHTTLAADP